MDQDELIFGKNAVLSFLESDEQFAASETADPVREKRLLEALSKRRAESGAAAIELPDLRQLSKGSKVRINKIMLATGGRPDVRIDQIQSLARAQRIPVHTCERQKLDQICGPDQRHQGVVAFISPAELWQLETFLEKLELDRAELDLAGKSFDGYMVALADGIEDPHNLGAIIRVAEAAGVKALLIPQRRAVGLTGTVAKISAGAIANLPVVRVSNLVQAIETLKRYGFWVVGLDGSSRQLHTQADLKRPLVVVIGSEGAGIGRLVKEHCDFLVKIPMLGKTESLNASVAAGIFFYEVVRQSGAGNNSEKPRKIDSV
jgi:23S rRNA (guanosine2251-2'-O)-methyltransferase